MSKQESTPRDVQALYASAFAGRGRYLEVDAFETFLEELGGRLGDAFEKLEAENAELRAEIDALKSHAKACSRARGLPAPMARRSWLSRAGAWFGRLFGR